MASVPCNQINTGKFENSMKLTLFCFHSRKLISNAKKLELQHAYSVRYQDKNIQKPKLTVLWISPKRLRKTMND